VRNLELQSECAFRAAAEGRLGARPLETLVSGIPRRVRGQLVHAALAHFWGEVGSRAALARLDEAGLRLTVARAVAAAIGAFRHYLPRGRIALLEQSWLERALGALAAVELERAPFTVAAREHGEALTLAGFRLNVRLDRLDRLDDGGSIVIDYKSGRGTPRRWRGARPDVLQLALYAAFRAEPPVAVALARLPLAIEPRRKFTGVALREGLLPGIPAIERASQRELRGLDWQALLAEWRAAATQLMSDYGAGAAAVDPAERACERCALQILCRIQERALAPEDAAPDDDEGTGGAAP
jgi:ATP-dependent helicase/nuclease subunit B